ncbi:MULTISPECIES: capsular polysaccharide export protein, LipB/KpsS family [Vibrio]|uniref:capsular polysaccharide export protein, LipB/KpsS family n=1 Tax=Vibrio TaxID=662 RepID=UPI0001B94EC6|nr:MULTISPECIES: hypothetical protein [Vibrio]AIS56146.2 hypothetical protein JV59_14245 [Vibrio coralliilyticus]EEX30736.1 hypothetical protein VIC_005032 [Vibrio coralliilyticus ATCC BAA-450]MCM5509483.1 hypothetical protein [Vibrio sp. SCSIO 43169]MDE3899610.1 hypothetical protein [Vibrio sp. CC007]QFT34985.1 hypothetical protein FIU99_00845 [Vibrio sp. THAF64]
MKKNLMLYAFDSELWNEVSRELSNNYNINNVKQLDLKLLGAFHLDKENHIAPSRVNLNQDDLIMYNQLVARRGTYYNSFPMVRDEFYYFIKLSEEMLSKSGVDCLVFQNLPHEGFDYILYRVAQELEIKTVICHQSIFSNRFYIFDTIDDYGYFKTSVKSDYPPVDLEKYFEEGLCYMKGIAGFSPLPELIYYKFRDLIDRVSFKKLRKKGYFRHRALKLIEGIDNYVYKKRKAEFFSANLQNLVNDKVKYVYFPLHQQPELTTSILGKEYEDQVLAIEHLAKLLPDEVKIVVKDNPRQDNRYRSSSFFNRLMSIKNVILIHSSTPSHKLLEHSICSATISGTIAWESAVENKYCIVFGHTWYMGLDNVLELSDLKDKSTDDIYNLISSEVKFEHTACNKIFSKMPVGIVDDFYLRGVDGFSYQSNAKLVAAAIECNI